MEARGKKYQKEYKIDVLEIGYAGCRMSEYKYSEQRGKATKILSEKKTQIDKTRERIS